MTMTQNNDSSRTPRLALRATAIIHDVDHDKYSVLLEFDKIDGTTGSLAVPRGDANHPTDVLRQLGNLGAVFPAGVNQKELFKEAMKSEPSTMLRTTRVGGWHGVGTFIQPHWKVGDIDLRWASGTGAIEAPPSGSLKAWRSGLKRPCAKSNLLKFGIGIAFASPLMKLVGEDEGATFNFHGLSSSGKSLSARVCQSTFASAAKSDLMNYGLSPRALEEFCFRRNDTVVLLDDEAHLEGKNKQAQAQDRRKIAFKIAGGSSDARSEVSIIRSIRWRANGFTSGEQPLGTRGRGEMVRHIDIPVGDHDAGIFRGLSTSGGDVKKRGKALAESVEKTIKVNFAVALPAYIRGLIGDPNDAASTARELRDEFITAVGATSSWDVRFAAKFGLVFAGMVLAARYDVAPWEEDSVMRTTQRIYREARAEVMTDEELAAELVFEVKNAVEMKKVRPLKKAEPLAENRVGFIRNVSGNRSVAIRPLHLARFTGSTRLNAVVKLLNDQRIVRSGSGKSPYRQLQVTVGNENTRFRWVCFDYAALGIVRKKAA